MIALVFVYDVGDFGRGEELVILPTEIAEAQARRWTALNAQTWGSLRLADPQDRDEGGAPPASTINPSAI